MSHWKYVQSQSNEGMVTIVIVVLTLLFNTATITTTIHNETKHLTL